MMKEKNEIACGKIDPKNYEQIAQRSFSGGEKKRERDFSRWQCRDPKLSHPRMKS